MKKSEAQKKLDEVNLQMQVNSRITDLDRSRSLTVGTSFGGTTEISMRGDGGKYLWCILQPVEVAELIHQLAANIGCHMALKPRDDFSSWRQWKISEAEKKHLQGHPPFVNDMAPFREIGMSNFDQKKAEEIFEHWLNQKEYPKIDSISEFKNEKNKKQKLLKKIEGEQDDKEAMATKEDINKRRSKRTSSTT